MKYTPEEIVAEYFKRGYRVVFWAPNGADKGPKVNGWQVKPTTLEDYVPGHRVGLITGVEVAPGKFLHDIDIDWGPGATIAGKMLPGTRFVYGRAGKKFSHCFYLTDAPIVGMKYDDPADGTTLIELRGTKKDGTLGWQSMAPPSDWRNKNDLSAPPEMLQFVKARDGVLFDHPAEISAELLQKRVSHIVVAMMFAKALGKNGFGHDVRLAWAGFLLKMGLEVDEVVLMGEAMSIYCNNLEVEDVRVVVETTFRRMQDSKAKVKGGPVFLQYLGTAGAKILQKAKEWLGVDDEFIVNSKGTIKADSQENLRKAFNRLGVVLSYDTFAQKAQVSYEGYSGAIQDSVANRIRFQIESQFHFLPTKDHYQDVLQDTAYLNSFHPIHDYLKSLTWDGTPRVDEWVIKAAGAKDDSKGYTRAVSGLTLLAAVKRILQPGCKFDEMLVLESGTQGLSKSSALRALCPEDSWFSDDLPLNLDAKQIVERTLGKWIIEASDLSGMSPKNVEHLKAMLSRQVDGPVRMAYGRFPVEQPRQYIIIGTTNSYDYLSDVTGNRRFWPIRVGRFDVAWIREHRDQLWAEAYQRVLAGESIRLREELYEIAGSQQESRRASDPWEHALAEAFPGENYRLPMAAIWEVLNIEVSRQNANDAMRVAKIMQLLGFRRMTIKYKDKITKEDRTVKGWGKGHGQRDEPKLPLGDSKRKGEDDGPEM